MATAYAAPEEMSGTRDRIEVESEMIRTVMGTARRHVRERPRVDSSSNITINILSPLPDLGMAL